VTHETKGWASISTCKVVAISPRIYIPCGEPENIWGVILHGGVDLACVCLFFTIPYCDLFKMFGARADLCPFPARLHKSDALCFIIWV
jgi:hypothetical protein